jgi:aminopeptidase N
MLLLLLAGIATSFSPVDTYPKNYGVDMLNYAFHVSLSDETDAISGRAEIALVFVDAGQQTIRFDLVQQSDALGGKGMTVSEVRVDGAATSFRHQDNQLWVDLRAPSQAGQHAAVTIFYGGVAATGLVIGPNKHGDRTFFSDNWPNRARNWLPTVDHPYDKATNEFIVTAPERYQVVSNGLQVEESSVEGGMKRTHWINSVPIATWLYVMGVAEFAVQRVGEFDHKEIQTWVFKQDRDAGFHDFAVPTAQTLGFFSDHVGPYAYQKLANIQSNSVGGGMEAASAIFYGDRSVTGERSVRWRNVVIHEIAHQWFGNAVTESDWDDVWLSEGFATYFTLLFREHAYGRDDFVTGLKNARDRVWRYYSETDSAYRIVHRNLDDMSRVTSSQTYQRGAWVLHMLRDRIGDEAWWSGIQSYYHEFFNANATTRDFRRHMEAASGQELSWYFDQWLYQGGHVVLEGDWRWNGSGIDVTLAQVQEDGFSFRVPVEIGVFSEGDDTPTIHRLELGMEPGEFRIELEKRPERVVLDPRTVLLARWSFARRR